MTAQEIINSIRLRVDDTASPYLWSDAEIVEALNWTQERMVEDARLIRLTENVTYCKVDITSGTARYSLSDKVCRVNNVYDATNEYYLSKITIQKLNVRYPTWRTDEGAVDFYFFEARSKEIRLFRIPEEDMTLWLDAYFLPLSTITTADLTESPEIQSEFHKYLENGILHRLFSNYDADKMDKDKSLFHLKLFNRDVEIIGNKVAKAEYGSELVSGEEGFL